MNLLLFQSPKLFLLSFYQNELTKTKYSSIKLGKFECFETISEMLGESPKEPKSWCIATCQIAPTRKEIEIDIVFEDLFENKIHPTCIWWTFISKVNFHLIPYNFGIFSKNFSRYILWQWQVKGIFVRYLDSFYQENFTTYWWISF